MTRYQLIPGSSPPFTLNIISCKSALIFVSSNWSRGSSYIDGFFLRAGFTEHISKRGFYTQKAHWNATLVPLSTFLHRPKVGLIGIVALGSTKETPLNVIFEPVFYWKGSLDATLSKPIIYPLL